MKRINMVVFLVFLFISVNSQVFTDSNLPIVIINTDINPNTGQPFEIPDEPKILATMKIIFRTDGSRNFITDQNTAAFLNYNGRIAIELRGSSSQDLPKKPYGLTTLLADNTSNNNVSILGMPKENDWVLNSLAFDPSMIRDVLSYELGSGMGNYAARGKYCEVIVNGDYKGVYVFMEKLKIDSNRINILKMTKNDNALPELSGGYITKADKTTGGDPVAWTMASYNGTTAYIHENPKPVDITSQQHAYIQNQFNALQNKITAKNESLTDGYPSIIDVPSFVDFIIINEIAANVDGYQFSTFFHKDREGKLRAGPIWDFNLTFGNDLFLYGYDRSFTNVWQFDNGDNTGSKFWKDLYNNATFKCYLSRRWKELTAVNEPLSYNKIVAKIDSLASVINESKAREQARWNTIGNHSNHIVAIKTWLQSRMNWINTHLNNYQACANPDIPPLVISKINYNPANSTEFGSDDLEFIEITNNSNQVISLTGVYFRELGLSYQFPANSSARPNGTIYLASNSAAFRQYYGFTPFGQYTRNLSNKTQRLVLADGFGNTIDLVEYFDTTPWPTEADGKGSYLKLNNLNSDNNVAGNWIASNQPLSVNNKTFESNVVLSPNPSHSKIEVYPNDMSLLSYEIFDLAGRRVLFINNPDSNVIDIKHLSNGTYFVKMEFSNSISTIKKIVKN